MVNDALEEEGVGGTSHMEIDVHHSEKEDDKPMNVAISSGSAVSPPPILISNAHPGAAEQGGQLLGGKEAGGQCSGVEGSKHRQAARHTPPNFSLLTVAAPCRPPALCPGTGPRRACRRPPRC